MQKTVIEDDEPKFVTGNLMKHVSVMSFTASIGLMAIFAVDFVDLLFISMLGNIALAAAVGYAGIILFFTNSINMGLSIAAGTLVAQSLGKKDKPAAREYATAVMLLGFVSSIFVVIAVLMSLDNILGLIGAEGETLIQAKKYIHIILPTMPFMSIGFAAMAVLRAYGDAKRSMYCTLYGGLLNAVLAPIFIFALDFGLEGAAMASVAARFLMIYLAVSPLIKSHDGMAPVAISLITNHIKPIFSLLVPAILANVATPIGSAIIMREMAKFGTDAVAGMAIIGRMSPVVFSVVFALSGAIGPIVGQNFGAGKMDRVRTAFIDGLKFTFIYVLIVSVILFFVRDYIVDIFGVTGEAAELVILFCGFLSLTFFFNGVIFVANACFNNLGYPIYSTYVNWGRNTFGTLPFILVGASYWGASGILLGQALGGAIFAIIALWLSFKIMNAGGIKHKVDAFHIHSRIHNMHIRRR
ncbi:MAG: MATE family efflux transporter [Rhizobiales bacterium]|nr:MATE family efflux transporter [Hyphomicrobiales bacterium]